MHTFFFPDPDGLADMVSIMINKHTYKPSVKDIMEKCYEMFRVKNRGNKADFFNSPEGLEDSDTDGELEKLGVEGGGYSGMSPAFCLITTSVPFFEKEQTL